LVVAAAGLPTAKRASAQESEPPQTFLGWLEGVRADALSRGIRPEVLDQALADLEEPLPVVIERDRTQAELTLPLETYLDRRITPALVRTGRQMLARHRALLAKVSETYGVPASVIVSIWGLESNFGRFTGVRPTIAALATLAWDPRRAALFREELLEALEILNRGDVEFAKMRGSWAGAMGQPQFMPSSYLRYAVDFDGDGRRDIWSSQADIFASVANYLKGYGWTQGYRWGRAVTLSSEAVIRTAAIERRDGSCSARRDMSARRQLADWHGLGVRLPGGRALPAADLEASLVSGASRHFLVYDNYDALLAYNCAHAYALSVALLAERIG